MYLFGRTINANLVRLFLLALLLNLAACGTILHPERKNQHHSGQIDLGVAILDGIGLLFFIVPGVIAYAVDFSNNTIYLPHGHSSSLDAQHKYTQIHIDGKMDQATIEQAIRAETGMAVDLNQARVKVVKLESPADLDARFAAFEADPTVALAQ
jgi:hypothetical protein